MNDLSMSLFRKFVEEHDLAEGKTVVDVGSLDYNGTYRPLFPGSRYVGADIEQGPNVDVIVGSDDWNALKDVDAVISGNTFEHVENESELLGQIYAILKAGGMLCVSAPSVGPAHPAPKWYRYYTEESMTGLLRDAGFEILSCTTDPHPEFMFVTCVARKGGGGGWRRKAKESNQVSITVSEALATEEKLR